MDFINQKEYRIFGIKRSGNHAIINWIFSQIQGKSVFLNNCYLEGNKKLKLYDGVGRIECRGINYWDFKKKLIFWERLPDFEVDDPDIIIYSKNDKRFKSEKLKLSVKNGLIISFENRDIDTLSYYLNKDHDQLVGKSQDIFSLIILRDPFNLFASNYKKWGKQSIENITDLWKNFAKKYIEYQNSNDPNFIGVNYNKWFKDKNYRQEIVELLKLNFTDENINQVREFGDGSSFDGYSPEIKASDLDVLNRWQSFENDPLYRALFLDGEIFDLSEQIFGYIPQTEKLKS